MWLGRLAPGDWTFIGKCSGRRPLLPLESAERALEGSPGRREAQEPLAPPWVSVPTHFSSPPEPCRFPKSRLSLFSQCFSARSMICANGRSCPLTLAISPNTKNVLGEREQVVGWVTSDAPAGAP